MLPLPGPAFTSGRSFKPRAAFNPGSVFNPGPTLTSGRAFNPGRACNPGPALTSGRAFIHGRACNPGPALASGRAFNPGRAFTLRPIFALRLAAVVCCLLGGGPARPGFAAAGAPPSGSAPPEPAICERAGAAAERARGVPPGLLLAIGRVESGRWDSLRERQTPWPWTINAAGRGQWFETAEDAVRSTRALLDAGTRSIDVGCFQVNLMYHPAAFASPEQGFDPDINAAYAARFLTELMARTGSWEGAVEAYHSSNAARGLAYRQQVFASWLGPAQGSQGQVQGQGGPGRAGPGAAPFAVPPRVGPDQAQGPEVRVGIAHASVRPVVAGGAMPLVVSMAQPFAGVRVVTPLAAGRAPRIVLMPPPVPAPPLSMTANRIMPDG